MTGLGDRLVSMRLPPNDEPVRMTALEIASANCTRLCEIKWVCDGDDDMDPSKRLLSLIKGLVPSLDVEVQDIRNDRHG